MKCKLKWISADRIMRFGCVTYLYKDDIGSNVTPDWTGPMTHYSTTLLSVIVSTGTGC